MAEFANPEAYGPWIGRWNRRLAPLFIRLADLPDGGRLLDVGSGTGALAETLFEIFGKATIVGIEPAEAYAYGAVPRELIDHRDMAP